MDLNKIVQLINAKLAGELFTYAELESYMDEVIDDINTRLNAKFPVFSEFNSTEYPQYPNYNFFPDKYIRSVVVCGAASKFYTTDEEGAVSASIYSYEYMERLFNMVRDFSVLVPEEYQAEATGFLTSEDPDDLANTIKDTSLLFDF